MDLLKVLIIVPSVNGMVIIFLITRVLAIKICRVESHGKYSKLAVSVSWGFFPFLSRSHVLSFFLSLSLSLFLTL